MQYIFYALQHVLSMIYLIFILVTLFYFIRISNKTNRMITRIEIIEVLLSNEKLIDFPKIAQRMRMNFIRMDEYDFINWYQKKFGHTLQPIRKNLYF